MMLISGSKDMTSATCGYLPGRSAGHHRPWLLPNYTACERLAGDRCRKAESNWRPVDCKSSPTNHNNTELLNPRMGAKIYSGMGASDSQLPRHVDGSMLSRSKQALQQGDEMWWYAKKITVSFRYSHMLIAHRRLQ